jgi:hypothetical protein
VSGHRPFAFRWKQFRYKQAAVFEYTAAGTYNSRQSGKSSGTARSQRRTSRRGQTGRSGGGVGETRRTFGRRPSPTDVAGQAAAPASKPSCARSAPLPCSSPPSRFFASFAQPANARSRDSSHIESSRVVEMRDCRGPRVAGPRDEPGQGQDTVPLLRRPPLVSLGVLGRPVHRREPDLAPVEKLAAHPNRRAARLQPPVLVALRRRPRLAHQRARPGNARWPMPDLRSPAGADRRAPRPSHADANRSCLTTSARTPLARCHHSPTASAVGAQPAGP